jgi:transcription termination factor Rho
MPICKAPQGFGRVLPAIDVARYGTRTEELLLPRDQLKRV